MNLNNLEEQHKILFDLLRKFDAYCRKKEVKYFLFAGTELGAVREHGFIPWDGDIDIMLTFEEYQKLLKAARSDPPEGFKLINYEDDKNIPSLYAKVFVESVDAEHLEDFNYIELLPFTRVPKSHFKRTLLWKINYRNSQIYWVKNRIYKNNMSRKHNKIGMLLKILLFWWPNKLSVKIFKSSTETKKYANEEIGATLLCLYNVERTGVPMQWFEEEPVYMQFEEGEFPVIREYDKHLRQMYGDDYMIPKQYKRYTP